MSSEDLWKWLLGIVASLLVLGIGAWIASLNRRISRVEETVEAHRREDIEFHGKVATERERISGDFRLLREAVDRLTEALRDAGFDRRRRPR